MFVVWKEGISVVVECWWELLQVGRQCKLGEEWCIYKQILSMNLSSCLCFSCHMNVKNTVSQQK